MSLIDYTIFYKEKFDNFTSHNWKLLISAYNSSDRVKETFKNLNASVKYWLIFPEYNYQENEYPPGRCFDYIGLNTEDAFISKFLEDIDIEKFKDGICIDITGFIRPHLIYLIRYLSYKKIYKFDVLYSEPLRYYNHEETKFSALPSAVRTIPGCSSNAVFPNIEKDTLILASGYDDRLISLVAQEKKHCSKKFQIFGLPSLQPDMYQENILRAYNASESLGNDVFNYYAPANDPFVTAQTIQTIIERNKPHNNIFLSPLSTKAQTLGFILYYLWEGIDNSCSIVFPYSDSYSKQTTLGLTRTIKYTIELPKNQ